MKRSATTILLLLLALLTSWGATVDQAAALKKAAEFMKMRGHQLSLRQAAMPKRLKSAVGKTAQPFYVFNADNGQGFVVVSGDDRTPAILGYADTGTMDLDRLPANAEAWLKGYAEQIGQLTAVAPDASGLRASGAQLRTAEPSTERKPIAPLIQTEWDQVPPYNILAPLLSGDTERCATGCTATAMAQIMNYHRWPQQTTQPIPGYTTHSLGLEVDDMPVTAFDWDNMAQAYFGGTTAAQDTAVAVLMLACGAALSMDYASTSLAYDSDIIPALVNYFDYDLSARLVQRNSYKAADWHRMLYDELAANRPVLYGASSIGGGHSLIVDGYDRNDYFHVNWGWGGDCDGFFLLSVLDSGDNSNVGASTTEDGYSFDQSAVIGIQPNIGTTAPPLHLTPSSCWAEKAEYSLGSDDHFSLHVQITDWNEGSHAWNFGWALLDADDKMLGVGVLEESYTLTYSMYFPDYGAHVYYSDLGLSKATADGTYMLKLVSRIAGTGEWYVGSGSENAGITLVVSGGKLTLSWPPTETKFDLAADFSLPDVLEYGVDAMFTVTLTNNGTAYNNDIFLLVNGTPQEGRHLELEPGETTTMGFKVKGDLLGAVQVALATRFVNEYSEWDYAPFATKDVAAQAPKANLYIVPTVKGADAVDIITSSTVFLNLHVTNQFSEAYTKDLIVEVYKLKDGNNGTFLASTTTENLNLSPGESTDIEVSFDGMEDGAGYFADVIFASEEGYYFGNEVSAWWNVNYAPASLTVVPTVTNGKTTSYNRSTLYGTKVELSCTVSNKGRNSYAGPVMASVCQVTSGNDGFLIGSAKAFVSVAAGETTDVKLVYDGLEDGRTYFFVAGYESNGAWTQGWPFTPYVDVDLQTVGVDMVNGGVAGNASKRYDTPAYDLQGRRIDASQLKSGIYIINGKKFIKR